MGLASSIRAKRVAARPTLRRRTTGCTRLGPGHRRPNRCTCSGERREQTMNKHPSLKISVLFALGLLACAKDPGAGKAAAEVKPAQQEKPLEAAADAKAEKLAITPEN